jgi:hypothetical protein
MDESVRRAQSALPVGIDRVTRELVTLDRALAEPEVLAGRDELTLDERMAVVRRRWQAGAWLDVLVCDDEVDLERGIAELEAQSPIGKDLMHATERAIEMVLEDARA